MAKAHEGNQVKALIKSIPMEIGKAAALLEMSRQNLSYHFRKETLDDNFERLIKDKLKIVRIKNGFTIEGAGLEVTQKVNDKQNMTREELLGKVAELEMEIKILRELFVPSK